MAKFAASYDFLHHPELIYGILSDVERMGEFMPLCKRSQIFSRRATGHAEVVEANFLLRYREIGFEREFDLELTLWPDERRIDIGPIQTAAGSGSACCTVTATGLAGSRVLFETDFRISNVFVRLFFGRRLLRQGVDRIMDRVRQRAEALDAR